MKMRTQHVGERRQELVVHLWRLIALIAVGACVPSIGRAIDEPNRLDGIGAEFRRIVKPFVEAHCIACHSGNEPDGGLRLDDELRPDFGDRVAQSKWGEIIDVLNGHQMPPETEAQPSPDEVARVVDWIAEQLARVEAERKESSVLLRRLTRDEYRHTIRDLVGVDVDVSNFPLEAAAGGFDNNGVALTMSPLHVELYYQTARRILDTALVRGSRPETIRWRFEPESGDDDSNRVRYGTYRAIVNGGNNPVADGFKIMHHHQWDKHLNARDFAVPAEGIYIIRVRGGSKIPDRAAVVASAEKYLARRRDQQMKENPGGARWHDEQYQNDLKHFQVDRMYDYGPARLKLVVEQGGQPKVIGEFDLHGSIEEPKVHEFQVRCGVDRMGITLEYAYSLPRVLENFWMQTGDEFARPEAWVDWFEIEGPFVDAWPPSSHRRTLGIDRPGGVANREDARKAIVTFLRRAYRRPARRDEIEEKLSLYDVAIASGADSLEAIKKPLVAALCSPSFLYLLEPRGEHETNARRLDEHELATRLSYFLWASMPDDALLQLASAKKLREPDVLKAQVQRMLQDEKHLGMVEGFVSQWLGLREVGANPPAQDLYPHYDRHLEESMVRESLAFFDVILQNDFPASRLIQSDFVVINERLARFYGIPGVRGDHFRQVVVPQGVHRGGVVTQAAIHTITSNGTRTSPVKRGTWVLKNLLGMDPGLPVANAGDIAPKVPGIDKATVRKRLEVHRSLPQCARCHNKIDPLGFALENYNACGEWRDQEGFGYNGRIERDDPPIDATSRLPDGTAIVGVDGLQRSLLENPDKFLQCFLGKLMTYALGREMGPGDQKEIQRGVAFMKSQGSTIRSAIDFIVLSDAFQTK